MPALLGGVLMLTVLGAGVGAGRAPDGFEDARQAMVARQLQRRDITDPRVLVAMGTVPRHRFVPEALASRAYGDYPLPIGEDQTISQPYIVALMTQWAEVQPQRPGAGGGDGFGVSGRGFGGTCRAGSTASKSARSWPGRPRRASKTWATAGCR